MLCSFCGERALLVWRGTAQQGGSLLAEGCATGRAEPSRTRPPGLDALQEEPSQAAHDPRGWMRHRKSRAKPHMTPGLDAPEPPSSAPPPAPNVGGHEPWAMHWATVSAWPAEPVPSTSPGLAGLQGT
eukprot:366387-Chlamydomonas_euryale.AAC.19